MTDEQKAKYRESYRRWYVKHREEKIRHMAEYRNTHKEEKRAKAKACYNSSQFYRAGQLFGRYKSKDLKYGRETTIAREWIVDHIFSSSCIYCGESDWHKLGCDRKDNSIGHTPENCVPCCSDCNNKRKRKEFHQYIGSQWTVLGRLRQEGSSTK